LYSYIRKVACTLVPLCVLDVPKYIQDGKMEERMFAGAKFCEIEAICLPLVCYSLASHCLCLAFECGIAPPPRVGRESKAEQISAQKLRISLSSHVAVPKITPQHNLTEGHSPHSVINGRCRPTCVELRTLWLMSWWVYDATKIPDGVYSVAGVVGPRTNRS
jgi:hypothetical protein